jgi:NTP pyrophosphatase (non-canonical NTP hydrolase)
MAIVTGMELIDGERQRQIEVKGHDPSKDKNYLKNELYYAGCCYYAEERTRAICDGVPPAVPSSWPWAPESWKPSPGNRLRELEKAGALFKADYEISESSLSYDMMMQCAKDIDKLLKITMSESLVKNPFEQLTQLQKDFGYTTGEINPVALLGLFGEAGEVLGEVLLSSKGECTYVNTLQGAAVNTAEMVDNLKKHYRKNPEVAADTFILRDDDGEKLDLEMADVLYYLNLLALNRGKQLEYYAQLSIEKVKAKSKKM